MTQFQCPNCGGFDVYTVEKKNETIWSERFQVSTERGFLRLLQLFIILFVLFALSLAAHLLLSNSFTLLIVILAAMAAGLGVVLVLFVLLTTMIGALVGKPTKFTERKKLGSITHYSLQCNICKYRWNWSSNQPYPKVNVSPDLLALGAQRRKQEEEEYLQQLAAWWITNQQKKK